MLDFHVILANLAAKRPIFHSEADFQHALAWELHEHDQEADIRLEKRISLEDSRIHLDLLYRSGEKVIAIELKYKTRAVNLQIGDEGFDLLDQSAQDIGRHDYIKDISRLESYVRKNPQAVGYAILLTNDHLYWKKSKKDNPVDSAFRLDAGRIVQGSVTWNDETAPGTKYKREEPIDLSGEYTIAWHDYCDHGEGKYRQFRYSLVRVAHPRIMVNPSSW